MIRSFRDKETEALYYTGKSRKFQSVQDVAARKLRMLDASPNLSDLSKFRGHHLEKLSGDREGQYSIRVNDQYRICSSGWGTAPATSR